MAAPKKKTTKKEPELLGRHVENMAHAITWRVTLNLVIGVVLTVLTVAAALIWMAERQDAQAAEGARTMISGGIVSLEGYVQGFANDYSWWQAGYDAYMTGDRAWVDENFGSGIIDTQISDTIIIISTSTKIDYAWAILDIPTPPEEVYTQDVLDDIAALASDMPLAYNAARVGYVLDKDKNQIIMLAVNRISPVDYIDQVDPRSLALLVQAIYLNDERLSELGEQFLIHDLHLEAGTPSQAVIDAGFPLIKDMDGQAIGALLWTPPTPGSTALKNVAVPVAIALIIFTIIVALTSLNTRKVARALSSTSRDLQYSEYQLAKQLTAVAAEKEKIETIVESVGEGMLVADPDGIVFMANKAATQMLAKTHEQLISRSFKEVFNVKGAKKDSPFGPILDIVKRKATVKVEEAAFFRSDRQSIILSLTATPVEHDGELIGSIVVFHDVTEQKLIAVAKDRFITTAAHQLRTPLSGLRWTMNLLLDGSLGELNPQQNDIILQTHESVKRLNLLINDLLSIDKFGSEDHELNLVPTDMKQLLESVMSDLRAPISEKRINIQFNVADGLPQLSLDKGLIQVVFQNLIDNAVKYSSAEGKITVEAGREGSHVHVKVIDEGIGIPRSQQKSIFTRFFRASNALLFEPNGSGLGLFITKQIIEKHGGEMWFESQEGSGTTFHVVFHSTEV